MDADTEGDAVDRPVLAATEELVREVAATALQVTIVRQTLLEWLHQHAVNPDISSDIVLAATEAMANVVDHAYPKDPDGTLVLTASAEHGFLTVTVTDTGHWKDNPSDTHRGKGNIIIRAVAPEAAITTTPTGTTVRLIWPWISEPKSQP